MTKVAVIIPNFNGAGELPECLTALSRQTFTDFAVVVVDDRSTDGSLEMVRERFPTVTTIGLDTNRGFAAAANAGITRTVAPYVVLLNNDTRASNDWLERLVIAMDETPSAGFGASKLVRYDDPSIIDSAGDAFIPRTLSGHAIGKGERASCYDVRRWVFGACAAASIYRRTMLEDIGLLDEDFFLTHEDVDLSMRAQIAGYRCIYVPDAVVEHKRRASYELVSPEIEAIGLRNRVWVVGKNAPLPLLLWWMVIALPHVIAMIVRKLVWGRRTRPISAQTGAAWTGDVIRAHLAPVLWSGLSSLPAKRRAVRHTRRSGSCALLRAIQPAVQGAEPHRAT